MKLVFIGWAAGGVLSRLAPHAAIREMTLEAVADRPCGFIDIAAQNGMATEVLATPSGPEFSRLLDQRYAGRTDLIFLSFYCKLFRDPFLAAHEGRIFNCHPSILPASPGAYGFEDTIASRARFMGCTLHQVDAGIDTGAPVIQAALPVDPAADFDANRHKVYLSQVYTAAQFLRWVAEERFDFGGKDQLTPRGARFSPSAYAPNLDEDFFDWFGAENELA